MYQSAMLHKYKQNVTFNVINTQIIYIKEKPMKKQGVGNFSIGGSIFYYSILNPAPGHFYTQVNILSDTDFLGELLNQLGWKWFCKGDSRPQKDGA